jgi:hyperosmotically inducible periplasmic protein
MKKLTILMLSMVMIAGIVSCGPGDDQINQAVSTALSGNAALGAVSATVKDGIVTLEGEVENDDLKSLAQTTVNEIKGVKTVVNNVSVKPKGPTPEELKQAADTALQSKVMEAFAKYKVTGITATVADSVVTLSGDIKRANLQNAMKAAMEVAPKKVENKMTVK